MIHFLDITPNQPSKFTTKNWVEINDDSRGTYNTNKQGKFKNSMLKSSLWDSSDAYMHVKVTITVPNIAAATAAASNTCKEVIYKNCASFTNCIN